MFKFEGLVDDKDLSRLMWAIDGMKIAEFRVHPARGGKIKHGRAVGRTNQTATEYVASVILQKKLKHITNADVREILAGSPFKPSGSGAVLKKLGLRKIIRKQGKGYPGRYVVTGDMNAKAK